MILKLPVPPSTNNLYATGNNRRRYRTPEYEAWITMAGWKLKEQRPAALPGKAVVDIAAPRNGRRDLDNHFKAILDLLVSCGVIRDDRHLERVSARWHDDADMKGYCLVEVCRAA